MDNPQTPPVIFTRRDERKIGTVNAVPRVCGWRELLPPVAAPFEDAPVRAGATPAEFVLIGPCVKLW